MNTLAFKEPRFISYLMNFESDKLGLFFSLIIHLTILIFMIGLPNFFEKPAINIPNVIPIEIVNVNDVTSIPKEINEKKQENVVKEESVTKEKKFNNSDIQEVQKIDEKIKPKINKNEEEEIKTPKQDVVLEKKKDSLIKLEKEKKIEVDEKIESLPTKKIKPKLKPKPIVEENINKKNPDIVVKAKPKPKPKSEFSIASMLKDLRNEKSTQVTEDKEEKKDDQKSSDKNETQNENVQLSISEIDLLRQQLSSCWIAPAGAVIQRGMIVKISAKLKQNRRIYEESVRIVDTNISKSNPFYGPITESAMRTLLNPDCIPLKLPEKKYNLWKNLTITFDYSIMKGY